MSPESGTSPPAERPDLLEIDVEQASWGTLRSELQADLLARYPEARNWSLLRKIWNFLTDPSLQAVLTVRLVARTPGRWLFVWRPLNTARFPMEVYRSEVGPGLHMQHPVNSHFGVGARVGSNVTIANNVTIGFARKAEPGHRLPTPTVGDRVVIGPNALIVGQVTIGSDTRVEAGALVTEDVPAGSVVKAQPRPATCFNRATPMPPHAPRHFPASTRRRLIADYAHLYAGRGESPAELRSRAPERFLTNPSLQAVAMIRAALASPLALMGLWRQLLVTKHSIDLDPDTELGPGLLLPHAFCILLAGPKIGSDVTIYHNVSIGVTGQAPGTEPVIGDRAVIHMNSVILPGAVIGADAVVGANTLVDGEIPPGAVLHRDRIGGRREQPA
jgi:serine acetyltransferase